MFLKNKNIIFKIRRSKVTDYAALSMFGLHLDVLYAPRDAFLIRADHYFYKRILVLSTF